MGETDLSFATVEELYEELKKRHEAIVVILEKPAPTGDSQSETGFYYEGGVSRALGMCCRLKARLLRAARQAPEYEE